MYVSRRTRIFSLHWQELPITDCLLVFDLPLMICKNSEYTRDILTKRLVESIISCNRSKAHEMPVTILLCDHFFFVVYLEKNIFYIITKENCAYIYKVLTPGLCECDLI